MGRDGLTQHDTQRLDQLALGFETTTDDIEWLLKTVHKLNKQVLNLKRLLKLEKKYHDGKRISLSTENCS